jgi:hypothetical protein
VQRRQPPKIRSINRRGVQPLHQLGGQRHVSATAAQKRPRLRAKLVGFHRADRRPQVSASSADNSGRGSDRRMATIGTTDNDAALSRPLCPFMTDILRASVGANIVLLSMR